MQAKTIEVESCHMSAIPLQKNGPIINTRLVFLSQLLHYHKWMLEAQVSLTVTAFHHWRALLPHSSTVRMCNPETFPPLEPARRSTVSVCLLSLIMSGRKPRYVANPLESAITTPSERILKECHSLYVDSENGKYPAATRITAALKHKQSDKSVLLNVEQQRGFYGDLWGRRDFAAVCQQQLLSGWRTWHLNQTRPSLGRQRLYLCTHCQCLLKTKPGYFHFKQM